MPEKLLAVWFVFVALLSVAWLAFLIWGGVKVVSWLVTK